jgi:CDP-diacylglycerol--serine O-phosphatidyltransferase
MSDSNQDESAAMKDEGPEDAASSSFILHPASLPDDPSPVRTRAHRRRRMRRHGKRAYIRSVYFLPSMATLGNAICGFAAMYVAAFDSSNVGSDPWAIWFKDYKFLAAAYLIFLAMIFDALDGRLARFTRHTTDFGGQLDSLADVVSFGAAPAFIALLVFKEQGPHLPFVLTRLIWAIGALYFSCAAIRLARFNVSNEHGEQHHFSFLGLPSPGAAGAVVAFILMQQDLYGLAAETTSRMASALTSVCTFILPFVVLVAGLLMVSNIRYPHVVNRWLRGRRPIARLLAGVIMLLLMLVAHRYVLGIGCLAYALYGPMIQLYLRMRPKPMTTPAPSPV